MVDNKEKPGTWGKLGGTSPMHSFAPTGTQKPGVSSQEGHSGSRTGIAPQAGGHEAFVSAGASNTDYAGTAQAGSSGPTKSGGNSKWAEGGKNRMVGNTGSQRAQPA